MLITTSTFPKILTYSLSLVSQSILNHFLQTVGTLYFFISSKLWSCLFVVVAIYVPIGSAASYGYGSATTAFLYDFAVSWRSPP